MKIRIEEGINLEDKLPSDQGVLGSQVCEFFCKITISHLFEIENLKNLLTRHEISYCSPFLYSLLIIILFIVIESSKLSIQQPSKPFKFF